MDDARIEQFKKMAEADPDNELGHFSLGKAYVEAGRHREAIPSLERVIGLNPQNSKAYYLLGLAQKGAGDRGGAIGTLRMGFDIAHERGDLMPRKEIAALMQELGEKPPVIEEVGGRAAAVGTGQVHCTRCNETKPKMAERPFKGALGEQVWASVCASCWNEWIHMGTKVINELRLNFADPKHSQVYDQHLKEFLNLP